MHIFSFSFGFKDVIDILLVTIILFETYRLLRRSGVANLFWGILAFIVVWFIVSYGFQLELTGFEIRSKHHSRQSCIYFQ